MCLQRNLLSISYISLVLPLSLHLVISCHFEQIFLKTYQASFLDLGAPSCTKFGKEFFKSPALDVFILDFRQIAAIRNNGHTKSRAVENIASKLQAF